MPKNVKIVGLFFNFVYKLLDIFFINFMPITKSAKKRVRQVKIRNSRNKIISLRVKKDIKKLLESLAKKDKKKSQDLFKICQKDLVIASNHGLLKKNKVSRKISSLNKKIKSI